MSSPQKCLHCAEQETLFLAVLAGVIWSGVCPVVDKMSMCICVWEGVGEEDGAKSRSE